MSNFGCHSCGVDLSKYKEYADSPCAHCKMANEYYSTPKAPFFDGTENEDLEAPAVMGQSSSAVDPALNWSDDAPAESTELTPDGIIAFQSVIEQQMAVIMSGIIMKMMRMAKTNPVMFEVVVKKMQFPHMSYSDIGTSMNPRITKQNVLYHLKHALEVFPELSSVFYTDTRFSAGKNALETVANRNRRTVALEKLRGVLYGDDESMKAMTMAEINSILKAPFLVDESVFDFNYYSDDEAKLRLLREQEKNREKMENEHRN